MGGHINSYVTNRIIIAYENVYGVSCDCESSVIASIVVMLVREYRGATARRALNIDKQTDMLLNWWLFVRRRGTTSVTEINAPSLKLCVQYANKNAESLCVLAVTTITLTSQLKKVHSAIRSAWLRYDTWPLGGARIVSQHKRTIGFFIEKNSIAGKYDVTILY